jgi:sugar diacid utilization regulator
VLVLIGTLRTGLARGGSADATAKALFCHPNTARYRLTEHRPLPHRPAGRDRAEPRPPG